MAKPANCWVSRSNNPPNAVPERAHRRLRESRPSATATRRHASWLANHACFTYALHSKSRPSTSACPSKGRTSLIITSIEVIKQSPFRLRDKPDHYKY